MKLRILSDLHLEFGDFWPDQTDADVTVLAGDIWHRDRGIRWASRRFQPDRTICILGNHEFYGQEFDDVLAACRRAAAETGIRFLENDGVVLDGVRFLGAALWSDFRLHGDGVRQQTAMLDAAQMLNDFRIIEVADENAGRRRLRPADLVPLHMASRVFLESELAKPFSGRTVVVTHFLPSARSIAGKHKGNSLNPYFCSDLEAIIEARQPDLWIHGHTHESFDYRIGRTRVLCNPRGYCPGELNPAFDPALVVDL